MRNFIFGALGALMLGAIAYGLVLLAAELWALKGPAQ